VFNAVLKTVRGLLKNVDIFMSGLQESLSFQLNIGLSVGHFYQDENSEVKEYHHAQQLICRKFSVEFVSFVLY